ncbi:MAG: glycosyltransferase family 2 protein [Spirochaetales bacterium]|nr:glycosyltransferase family 2 protein [Spirochaetales bacterium]
MSKPVLSIIIVTYNSGSVLEDCLESLKKTIPEAEVLVVDNHPEQTDTKAFDTKYSKVRFISNPANTGFGAGNNMGAREAMGEYLFFLNPDTTIEKFNLPKLMQFQKNNPDALTGFPLYYPDGGWCKPLKYLPEIDFILPKKLYNRLWDRYMTKDGFIPQKLYISGAAFIIKADLFQEAGGFDEAQFLFFEENALRSALLKLGHYKPAVLSEGFRIIHHEGTSYNRNAIAWYTDSLYHYASKYGKNYLIPYKLFCVRLSRMMGNLRGKDTKSKDILITELKRKER